MTVQSRRRADEQNGKSRTVKTTDGEAQIDISVFAVDAASASSASVAIRPLFGSPLGIPGR